MAKKTKHKKAKKNKVKALKQQRTTSTQPLALAAPAQHTVRVPTSATRISLTRGKRPDELTLYDSTEKRPIVAIPVKVGYTAANEARLSEAIRVMVEELCNLYGERKRAALNPVERTFERNIIDAVQAIAIALLR